MAAELSVLATSFKATIDIVKGLKSSYDAKALTQAQTQILEHLLTLQFEALSLQEKHSAVINEKQELVKKLEQFVQWGETEAEYELKEIRRGMFVYSSNNSQSSKIPTHWLCTQCWDERKKSILQARHHTETEAEYVCPRCNLTIRFFGAL
ncbi:MAG: hypothetical protein KAT05_16260 [Spirochaetes bacterium]|nr:hypothetical protein [Spirochaetota bacterium]